MDQKIEASLLDIEESFRILGRIKTPLIHIPADDIEQLKNFHKTRIKLNIQVLLESEELQ